MLADGWSAMLLAAESQHYSVLRRGMLADGWGAMLLAAESQHYSVLRRGMLADGWSAMLLALRANTTGCCAGTNEVKNER